MVKKVEEWRPPLVWENLIKEAVKKAYSDLNKTKPPHSIEDVDKVLIEAGASALLTEIMRHHSCYLNKGESYKIQRPDHVDLIEGPGWMIMLPVSQRLRRLKNNEYGESFRL